MSTSKLKCAIIPKRSSDPELFIPSLLWFFIPTIDLFAAAVLILSEKVTDYYWYTVAFNELALAIISFVIYSYQNYKAGNYFHV